MEEYSNREIDMKIEALQRHMADVHNNINEKLDMILRQTTQHNGRMRKMEAWRNALAGSIAVLTPAVAWIFYVVINHLTL